MRFQQGVTLIELLITLSIIVVSLTLATPSFQQLFAQYHCTIAINQLVDALAFARDTAITRQIPTSICPTQNGQNCSANWSHGYMVFVHEANNNTPKPETILALFPGVPESASLSNSRTIITLQTNGQAPGSNSTFYYQTQSSNLNVKATVILNMLGRVAIEKID